MRRTAIFLGSALFVVALAAFWTLYWQLAQL